MTRNFPCVAAARATLLAVTLTLVLALIPVPRTARLLADGAVLISIDGLRPDVLTAERTPALWMLREIGAYTFAATSHPPTYTLPNHVSLLTGVEPATHGITELVDGGDAPIPSGILELAQANGVSARGYVSKPKLRILCDPSVVDRCLVLETPEDVVAAFIDDLRALPNRRFLAFLHFDEPDETGHVEAWMSDAYLEAVTRMDALIEQLVHAIEDAELSPRTLVVVTSDHGGLGFSHGFDTPENRLVPWIAAGRGVRKPDAITRSVEVRDTAPTLLASLGVPVPDAMEGRAVREAFTQPDVGLLRRGDVDASGQVNVTDAVLILRHIAAGAPAPACATAADVDHRDGLGIGDGVFLLAHLFQGGPPLASPFPDCGRDLGAEAICAAACP